MPVTSKSKLSAPELARHFVGFRAPAVPLVPEGAVIEKAELKALKSNELPTYREIKSSFKTDLKSRDARFRLSEQVSSQLSVEQEEEQRFAKRVEEEVSSRLAILKAEAQAQGFQQ